MTEPPLQVASRGLRAREVRGIHETIMSAADDDDIVIALHITDG